MVNVSGKDSSTGSGGGIGLGLFSSLMSYTEYDKVRHNSESIAQYEVGNEISVNNYSVIIELFYTVNSCNVAQKCI